MTVSKELAPLKGTEVQLGLLAQKNYPKIQYLDQRIGQKNAVQNHTYSFTLKNAKLYGLNFWRVKYFSYKNFAFTKRNMP